MGVVEMYNKNYSLAFIFSRELFGKLVLTITILFI